MFSKKKLAAIMLSGVLVVGFAVGGATYAIFTSSVTNSNNSFKAGTVILTQERDSGDTIPGPMFYSATSDPTGSFPYDANNKYQPPGGEAIGGWAPGDKATRAMNIYNKGTLQAKINKLKANVNSAGVTSGDAYNEFIDKMNIKVMCPSLNKTLYDGKLSGLLNGFVDVQSAALANPNGGSVNITFEANLSKDAGNLIQGQSFVFDFTFSAEQTKNNP